MYVVDKDDRIEYVAAAPHQVQGLFEAFSKLLDQLCTQEGDATEACFYGAYLHLLLVKIHPFTDGNGRTARLLEKWFVATQLGEDAWSIPLEKNYFLRRDDYYRTIRALGLKYEQLDYGRATPFLSMTASAL